MEDIQILFSYISTYSGLLPIAAGVLYCRQTPQSYFLIFLIYGFLTDHLVGLILHNSTAFIVQNAYSLVDAIFLISFVTLTPPLKKYTKYLKFILPILLGLWFYTYKIYTLEFKTVPDSSAYFETTYTMLIAMLSAFSLLKMSEGDITKESRKLNWFLIGIFFYNFTSFFVFAFISESIIGHIWFLPKIFNILTMIMYTIGFLQLREKKMTPVG